MRRAKALVLPRLDRFKVLRPLGKGGTGLVYEAIDQEHGDRVAVKLLRALSADALLRFKREFRDFQDLQHPNLVSFRELFCERGEWFFTMELVDGVDMLTYARPGYRSHSPDSVGTTRELSPVSGAPTSPREDSVAGTGCFDEGRLRDALVQLTQGLVALHDAGKLHRDVKPSNVLVTPEGRVVLLDFGLATDLSDGEAMNDPSIVGTIAYMAPEQAQGVPLTPGADWYAVGVLLFEALTGTLPFRGRSYDVLMDKQLHAPQRPSQVAGAVPADLDELTTRLMRFSPAERPTGRSVLEALGVRPLQHALSAASLGMGLSAPSVFIGRARELAALHEALDVTREGQAHTLIVEGESGVGKTALVRHFAREISAKTAAIVLQGVCYERESVPYKGVDGAFDALSRYLTRLPKGAAAQLLPRQARLIADVFPVLARVDAFAEAAPPRGEPADPTEQRTRLFQGIRELFQNLTARLPCILIIDDLQWADADSLALLRHVLTPPGAPRLLLLATARTTSDQSAQRVGESLGESPRRLLLSRLRPEEARLLAETLCQAVAPGVSEHAAAIAQEAQGHPFFIDALVRQGALATGGATRLVQLEDALWARARQLPQEAIRALQVIALSSGRLVQQTAAKAAEQEFAAFSKQLALLRVTHLVRTTGLRSTDLVEPYHDRVRAAVRAHMDEPSMRHLHRRLAIAIEVSGHADPEALAVHWREAREPERALKHAELAAKKAARALAFDRAAQFYRQCLELATNLEERKSYAIRLGEVLADGGRGGESAEAFLAAARLAGPALALDLSRRAAEQLLRSGHIDKGVATLERVLASFDEPMTQTPRKALIALILSRGALRVRGLSFRERAETQLAPEVLMRMDAVWSAGLGLGMVDPIRGAEFQSRFLRMALAAGEPRRLARAFAMEAAFIATGGLRAAPRVQQLLKLADSLAIKLDQPHELGLVKLIQGFAAFQTYQWAKALDAVTQAEALLRACPGASWERSNGQVTGLEARYHLGQIGALMTLVPEVTQAGDARGDLYTSTSLRLSTMNSVYLFADEPQRARAEVDRALAQWSPSGYLAQHYYALVARVGADLYEGAGRDARQRLEAEWPRLERSLLLRVAGSRIRALGLKGRAALAAGNVAVADVSAIAAALLKEDPPLARPLALLLTAAVAFRTKRFAEAESQLSMASSLFSAADMRLFAEVARYRQGQLRSDALGDRLVSEASEWMRGEGIRRPERVVSMLAPAIADP